MPVLVDFLKDAAKIVFGSAVVGFFVPNAAGEVGASLLWGGAAATAAFLVLAVSLARRLERLKLRS